MGLTDEEKSFIARRAAGAYSSDPAASKIVKANKKNLNPEDQVFLDYIRWSLAKKWNKEDYVRLATAVLEVIPEPFGTPWTKKAEAPPVKKKPKKRRNPPGEDGGGKEPPKRKLGPSDLLDLFGAD